jgi:hypothetical protein
MRVETLRNLAEHRAKVPIFPPHVPPLVFLCLQTKVNDRLPLENDGWGMLFIHIAVRDTVNMEVELLMVKRGTDSLAGLPKPSPILSEQTNKV